MLLRCATPPSSIIRYFVSRIHGVIPRLADLLVGNFQGATCPAYRDNSAFLPFSGPPDRVFRCVSRETRRNITSPFPFNEFTRNMSTFSYPSSRNAKTGRPQNASQTSGLSGAIIGRGRSYWSLHLVRPTCPGPVPHGGGAYPWPIRRCWRPLVEKVQKRPFSHWDSHSPFPYSCLYS